VAGGRLACGVRACICICICICVHACLCVVHECLQVMKKQEHVACYSVVQGCLLKC
jgi:hypothetical protein